jgi:hypothetical protein
LRTNATEAKVIAKVGLAGAALLEDALRPETRIARVSGAFTVELPPRTARMFVVS